MSGVGMGSTAQSAAVRSASGEEMALQMMLSFYIQLLVSLLGFTRSWIKATLSVAMCRWHLSFRSRASQRCNKLLQAPLDRERLRSNASGGGERSKKSPCTLAKLLPARGLSSNQTSQSDLRIQFSNGVGRVMLCVGESSSRRTQALLGTSQHSLGALC